MALDAEIINKQLATLLDREDMLFKHQGSIKTWTVTVWVAVLAGIATQKIEISRPVAMFALASPVVLFWFLDGVHGGIRLLLVAHARELERRLATRDFETADPSEVFTLTRYERHRTRSKLSAFLRATFVAETNVVFYVSLLAATIVAVSAFTHHAQ
jgi:hypothetical protein